MVALEFRFLAGRYHATPWGHHVNEGLVEWPPSPWRITRALLATYYLKAQHMFDEAVVQRLLDTLSSELPRFYLPRTCPGHTRHYMPVYKGNTTKVFDAFLRLPDVDHPDAALIVAWPDIELERDQVEVLGKLVGCMGYLGRAESWVEVRLAEDWSPEDRAEVVPHEGSSVPAGTEVVRVLAPRAAHEYAAWRARWIEQRKSETLAQKRAAVERRGKDPARTKLSRKDLERTEALLPSTLWDALGVESAWLRKQGWSQPPGSRWIEYLRPRDALDSPRARPSRRRQSLPTVARFEVTSRQVRPRLTEALRWGAAMRRGLNGVTEGRTPEIFSGHQPDDRPSREHQHAHWIPEANDRRGLMTHISVYAPGGFDDHAYAALEQVRRIRAMGRDLEVLLIGLGAPQSFGGLDGERGQCPLFAESRVWESRTPFVPTRHGKRDKRGRPRLDSNGVQRDGPEADLRRLLHRRGFEGFTLEPLPHGSLGGTSVSWLDFATHRDRDHGTRASVVPCGFRISFEKPVRGPILAGYGVHFGLGSFVPAG